MSDSLHICYLCNEYPPASRVGGIGIFVQTIARALVRDGQRVTVVGLYDQQADYTDELDQGVRVVRISAKGPFVKLGWLINRLRLLATVTQLIDRDRVDLVEAPDYEGMFWMAPRWRVPQVVRLHGSETYFRRLLGEPLKLKHWISESRSIRKADQIASVSDYAWSQTKRLFGLPDQAVAILPNPVDCQKFRPASSAEIVGGRIVYSGTFIRKKGVLDLFAALPAVFARVPDAHIVCVGPDAADRCTSATSTQQLALKLLPSRFYDRVQFLGRLSHDQVVEQVRAAQVCVFPSHLETQGIVWIEAMACGKPVVASNLGPGSEIIEDGVSGLLGHPTDHQSLADRIVVLLRDREFATKLSIAARARAVDRFSLEHLLPANLQWYQRIIA